MSTSVQNNLLSAPIRTVLTTMSIPIAIGTIAILTFNLIDTFFISLLGTDALAAISFTFPITFFMTSLCLGLASGVSTKVARLLGQNNQQQGALLVTHGLLLTLGLIIALSVIGLLFFQPIFTLLGAKVERLPLIFDYMNIWYFSIPLLSVPLIANAAFRATGNTKIPSYIMIGAGFINMILDPLLIFGIGPFPHLGMQGAALASAISWAISCISALILLHRYKLITFHLSSISALKSHWQSILHVGRPAALTNILNPIASGIILSILARFDAKAVAAYGTGLRIESLLLLGIMALSSSLTPFVAQNLARGQTQRAYRALTGATHFALLLQGLLYILLALFAGQIASLFSQDEKVIQYLSIFLRIVPIAYGALGIVILLATSLNAYNRPGASVIINITRLFLLLLPMAWLGGQLIGINGVFAGMAIANIIMGGGCYIIMLKISESP